MLVESAMQTQNRFLDELAKIMTTAAGAAQGAAREAETLMRSRVERLVGDFDLVSRAEFDALKATVNGLREENETLKAKLDALEARMAGTSCA